MAETTGISWTTSTFNCWRGCQRVSAGCVNCYAETLSGRNPGTLGKWGPTGTRVVAVESYWKQPVKWNKAAACNCFCRIDFGEKHLGSCPQANRHRVFCASLADVFEDWQGPMVDNYGNIVKVNREGKAWAWYANTLRIGQDVATMSDVRQRLFDMIDATPNLDWLLLTKRPENISRMMPVIGEPAWSSTRPNLWIGTSVENQQAANERIPHLLRVPAVVRFLSAEPLLGDVNLTHYLESEYDRYARDDRFGIPKDVSKAKISWVIVGGESGPSHKRRDCQVKWIESIQKQCEAVGVPCFIKQDSGSRSGEQGRIPLSVWSHKEFPEPRL